MGNIYGKIYGFVAVVPTELHVLQFHYDSSLVINCVVYKQRLIMKQYVKLWIYWTKTFLKP